MENAWQTDPALEALFHFLLWLIPAVETVPRSQKFLLGDRIQSNTLLRSRIPTAYRFELVFHQVVIPATIGLASPAIPPDHPPCPARP